MAAIRSVKIFAQLQRELQEYRTSLLLTPMLIGGVLVLLMLGSVLIADRLSIVGDGVMQVLLREDTGHGLSIRIDLQDDSPDEVYVITEEEGVVDEEEWNFSREWSFGSGDKRKTVENLDEHVQSLNPVLNVLHFLFLGVMLFVSFNYLLGSLYQDRKDRSILFWKSLPVSEWQEVLCKLAVASVLTPLVFLGVSILTQLAYVVLAILLAWRLDAEPFNLVLGNIQFMPLFTNQLAGMLVWAVSTLPIYAWLMVASAAARRSPFMLAVAVPIGLILVEKVFIGSNFLAHGIFNHLPHMAGDSDESAVGFYMYGPVWSGIDYLGIVLGLGLAAGLLALAVWLRRHRFET